MVFNTKIINFINNELKEGSSFLVETPFYKGNNQVRKSNLSYDYTDEEINNILDIKKDIKNFYNFLIRTDLNSNKLSLKLREYQETYLNFLNENKKVISLVSRQTGSVLLYAIHILYYVICNNDKTISIIAPNRDSLVELIDIIKDLYCNLPFYLKVGVNSWNQSSLSFDNGCCIKTVNNNVSIGYTIDYCLILDYAYIGEKNNNIFMTALLPTISALAKSKIILSSTPNGNNYFYKLWCNSVNIDNQIKNPSCFNPFRIDYYVVPGRDAEWVNKTIEEVGGRYI